MYLKQPPKILTLYHQLLKAYGPQHWWPAESRFEIMLGAILTQNTNWTNVEKAIQQLKRNRCLTAKTIIKTPLNQLAAYIKSSGYYNQKAQRLKYFCEWYLGQGKYKNLQRVPTAILREALLALHGVGEETADDILLYAFDRPVFVIDAYTRRLLQRIGLITGKESYATLQKLFEESLPHDTKLFAEYHGLIVQHAKQHCRKVPICGDCVLRKVCVVGQYSNKKQGDLIQS